MRSFSKRGWHRFMVCAAADGYCAVSYTHLDVYKRQAFDEVDTYTSLAKQFAMLRLILEYQEKGNQALDAGANLSDVIALPVREQIGRAKYIPESEMKRFEQIESDLSSQCAALMDEGGEG